MRRIILSFSLIVVLITTALAQETDRRTALDSLVAAERAFCKAAAEHGIRDAFLANLADDSILFRPYAVNGKQWLSASPDQPGWLSWFPTYADVSAAGDLGYTTGPYEYHDGTDAKKVYHGYFMTIWKRQADGQWKAVLDQGVGGPLATAKAADLQFGSPVPVANQGDAAAWRDSLLKVDREFSAASEKQGAAMAYANYTADDLRLYRDGKPPFVGKATARAAFSVEGVLTWQPAKADTSRTGDLGYTYGMTQWKTPNAMMEYFNYVRLWKRQANDAWRVVLEVFNPCPPPNQTIAREYIRKRKRSHTKLKPSLYSRAEPQIEAID